MIISYYILFFNLIGGSLIYMGVRKHYLVQMIQDVDSINYAYYALAYCVIVFPATLLLMKKICNWLFPQKKDDGVYNKAVLYTDNMRQIQFFALSLVAICTFATLYVLKNLGYIPLLEMIRGGNLNALRQSGNRFFSGNQYIKNLLMTSLTPFISYLTYIYFRITKSRTWGCLFACMLLLSIVALTYDFSKSPIITYLIGLYLIEVALGNVKNNKWIIRIIGLSGCIILFFYVIVSKIGGSLFSIYSGPIGRILFTQIATLFLHFEAFPLKYGFLNGASFNHWMSFLFPAAEGLRSGRVVMSIYNASGVAAKTAGVMNTIFIGEAYANFGWTGVILAPIVFGVVIGFAAFFIPKLRKTPVVILYYVQLTLTFLTIVEGGFVDIFYNASTIFLTMVAIVLYFATKKGNMRLSQPRV